MNSLYVHLIIFIITLVLFIFINILLKKSIENYGIYCGRYNLNLTTAEDACSKDTNCAWVPYTNSQTRKKYGWCDNAPSKYKPDQEDLSLYNIINDAQKLLVNTVNIDEELIKGFI
jgi:hypothetical protein